MSLLNFFLSRKENTASIAKERLQIIIAEHQCIDTEPCYLIQLRKDILEVICKCIHIDPNMITVHLDRKDENISILNFSIKLIKEENYIHNHIL